MIHDYYFFKNIIWIKNSSITGRTVIISSGKSNALAAT